MNLVEVVILFGAQCLSPIETGPGLTDVGKVPCSVLIRQDPRSSDIEILPPSAATDPAVIAMLVRPHDSVTPVIKADRLAITTVPAPSAGDITSSLTRPPRIVPASSDVDAPDVPRKPIPVLRSKQVENPPITRKRVAAVSHRSRACGSSRAVWYTNKDGRRRYRCVKTG